MELDFKHIGAAVIGGIFILSPVKSSEDVDAPAIQLAERFGDLLGVKADDLRNPSSALSRMTEPLFGKFKQSGTKLLFFDQANTAGAISVSQADPVLNMVSISIDKSLVRSTYKDPAERREMVWFAMLHELQNGLRADDFRRLSRKAENGDISEAEYVRGELRVEVESMRKAYELYIKVLWPLMHDLGINPVGKVQALFQDTLNYDIDDITDRYVHSEMGEYYREGYRERRATQGKRNSLIKP